MGKHEPTSSTGAPPPLLLPPYTFATNHAAYFIIPPFFTATPACLPAFRTVVSLPSLTIFLGEVGDKP